MTPSEKSGFRSDRLLFMAAPDRYGPITEASFSAMPCIDAGRDELGQLVFNGRLVLGAQLVAQLLELLIHLEDHAVRAVEGFDLFLTLLVLGGVLLGFLDALIDLVLGQVGAGGDGHLLLVARAQILRRNVHDAVAVDVEGNLDLRHAARRRRNAGQLEAAQGLLGCKSKQAAGIFRPPF